MSRIAGFLELQAPGGGALCRWLIRNEASAEIVGAIADHLDSADSLAFEPVDGGVINTTEAIASARRAVIA
jgi:hypothetical protein